MTEKMYYANKFNLALGNIKKTWAIFKKYWDATITEIKIDNNLITDSK